MAQHLAKRVRATQFPLTMSMHLNYSLRKGSRSQFCHTVGKREEHSFLQAAWKLKSRSKLERIEACRIKTGVLGKAWLYKTYGITAVFDDRKEICKESLAKGLEAFPICNFREYHYWFRQQTGRQPYRTFAAAVQDLLRLRNIRV